MHRVISCSGAISKHEEIISEGLAKIIIPRIDLYKREDKTVEPAWMPVFYNPQGVVSRDLTTLFLKSTMLKRDFLFVDLLSGTGVRGIRISLEVGGEGLLNDIDPRAYHYIKRNILVNKLEGRLEAYNQEANTLLNMLVLSGITLDYVDVDPYGSPIPYIDSVFKPLCKKAYIGITATDLAPLSCTHPRKTLVRYWNKCIRVDFEKEYALRLLIASTAMRAAALGFAVTPLLSTVYKHYARIFIESERSYNRAFRVINECVGYIWYCTDTLERGYTRDPYDTPNCTSGKRPIVLGKTWICSITVPDTVSRVLLEAEKTGFLRLETLKILEKLRDEVSINTPYIRLDKLCSVLKVNMPKIDLLVSKLRELGFQATKTHMDVRGLKTNAPFEELARVIYELAKR